MIRYFTQLLRPAQPCGGCSRENNTERYTLLDAALDTLRGEYASDELHKERLSICQKCEYLIAGTNCRLCGCFVYLKARYARASCDIHRW
ncbi:MAG: DUF6171 family protein [Turneriella sp.]|nr:DUF6171 family protein [Turneriella sp.]